jgi:hypothetical protein
VHEACFVLTFHDGNATGKPIRLSRCSTKFLCRSSRIDFTLRTHGNNSRHGHLAGSSTIPKNYGPPTRFLLRLRRLVPLLRFAQSLYVSPPSSNSHHAILSLAHQALHTRYLYKHVHKIHHKYSAPFGLAAEYAHPMETAILGTGTIAGPLLYCFFMRDVHVLTVYVWITLRLFQAIDAHSGYGMPPHLAQPLRRH